jgi:hypothetical protein
MLKLSIACEDDGHDYREPNLRNDEAQAKGDAL